MNEVYMIYCDTRQKRTNRKVYVKEKYEIFET